MELRLKIPNISCLACVKRIENTLKEINGIKDSKVELSTKSAWLVGNPDKEEPLEKLKKIGYPVEEIT
ncbi:MAG: heavy-metal-associated domain-containing protein [Candidatus Aminicenantia bacterium]